VASEKSAAALATMRRLLAFDPQHPGALNYVGYSLSVLGSPAALQEAEPLLRRASALRPDDGAIADSLGFCLLRLGEIDFALVELLRADQLSPDDPVILGHLGDAYLAAGRRRDAEAAFRRALRDLPARAPGALAEPVRSGMPRLTEPREGGDERAADPSDAHVRDELEAKLRSLTAR
jgi:Flp pilus assembly protein TadD